MRSWLADAIRELALSPEEIRSLPDNLAATASAGTFAADYDFDDPRKAFPAG